MLARLVLELLSCVAVVLSCLWLIALSLCCWAVLPIGACGADGWYVFQGRFSDTVLFSVFLLASQIDLGQLLGVDFCVISCQNRAGLWLRLAARVPL